MDERTDTERLNWLEKNQRSLYTVVTVLRRSKTSTTQNQRTESKTYIESPYEEYRKFLGWSVQYRNDELPTVREAIDAAMDNLPDGQFKEIS